MGMQMLTGQEAQWIGRVLPDTGVFQQGLVSLCQVRVILASSLREVHSWWIFVRDLTLLMQ
jgi:hypothetical protein